MSKSYGKQDIISQLSGDVGLSKKQCGEIYDSIFSGIETALERGKEVSFPFGKISLVHVNDAEKRNVKTGEKVDVPAHTKPVFKFFKSFKEDVKGFNPIKD